MDDSKFYKPESAWKIYTSKREDAAQFAREYLNFISGCKTERETVAWVRRALENAGYGKVLAGELYFRELRGKAIFAFRRGDAPLGEGINIIAAHGDSPRLDFKQHPFVETANLVQAKTHYYGGIRKYQWLARPLALRGTIALENGSVLPVSIGDNPGDPVFCVEDLLPHLAQKQGTQKLNEAFEGEKLNIIIAHEPEIEPAEEKSKNPVKKRLLDLLFAKYGVGEEDFITAEMEAVPAGDAKFVGLDESMIGGYGQDDRICVFCGLRALLAAEKPRHSLALMIWDKEEIGSDGASGASSSFFQYCVQDLAEEAKARTSEVFLNSRAVSADVTAALDPDYQDVHEKQNAARLGYGPSFAKYTGSRGKYGASEADAEYFASLRALLNSKGIPWQAAELGKVDLGGGGTVALFLARHGIRVIDLGPALLSMHSPFELSSVADLYATWQAYKAFFED
ncbi:MAG: aminopeptidase [Desulfovibrio sp.]|nr:aminopeptidase [Desulfovibrio sp.]